jgi:ATP-dependent RNA helicase SUPV3L1/SUV3
VEGHFVGQLRGLRFDPAEGAGALEKKALRAAAQRAVSPEVARRLGALAKATDDAFALTADGAILWRGEAAAVLAGGEPSSPRVRLYGELGPQAARERASRRLEAFAAAEASRRLSGLRRLNDAIADGAIKGMARGIAWRLAEAGGVLARSQVETEVRTLSRVERRTLRGLGVRIGAFSVFLVDLLAPEGRSVANAFALLAAPDWRPVGVGPHRLPSPALPTRALALRGLLETGPFAVDVLSLERLGDLLRAAPQRGPDRLMAASALAALGWTDSQARAILRGLGYRPMRGSSAELTAWRRARAPKPEATDLRTPRPSPFAALSALKLDAPPRRRRSRRRSAIARG